MEENKTITTGTIRSEIPLLLITILPLVYLLAIWKTIPETVPLHFNFQMEADNFGSKWIFALTSCVWGPLLYILMYFIPKIDPKKMLKRNTKPYYIIRIAIQTLISAISIWIIYITVSYGKTEISFKFVPLLLSVFMIIFGNYMPTIKQNYFLGFRTPWTLESNEVWQRTHYWSGKAFFYGGLICLILSIILPETISTSILVGLILSITVWGFIYSYNLYKKLKRSVD